MGKDDFLTPKAIANRIKAKGLTKLRWYCQICEKPCRDENGFKCHCQSEAHMRKMALVSDSTSKFIDDYSTKFEHDFCDLISRRWRNQRVKATAAYSEYIADRHHTHMNATQWHTLTEFTKYLGKSGKAHVDQDDDGVWWISWIDRDPAKLARQEAMDKLQRHELDEREREAKFLERQMKAMQERDQAREQQAKELVRDPAQKIGFSFAGSKGASSGPQREQQQQQQVAAATSAAASSSSATATQPTANAKRVNEHDSSESKRPKLSAVEEIMQEELARKAKKTVEQQQQQQPKAVTSDSIKTKFDNWLFPNIVVKILNKSLLNGEFYKKKAVVEEVIDDFVGKVRILESGDVVKIDQAELETVIPRVDGDVLIVNGPHRGERAKLQHIDADAYCAVLELLSGQKITNVAYEDFSKLHR